jgi:LacI family transcriptional regulator
MGYQISELLDELMQKGSSDRVVFDKPTHVEVRQSTDVLAIDDVEVAKAMQFIRENRRNMIQLQDVVEQTCLSKRSLELRFKKVIGSSICDEIRRCKINEVCKLLLTTVMKIAIYMGFSGSDHISRYFSQIKGISLLKFRKKYKGSLAREHPAI